jgi:hypothetical protein
MPVVRSKVRLAAMVRHLGEAAVPDGSVDLASSLCDIHWHSPCN